MPKQSKAAKKAVLEAVAEMAAKMSKKELVALILGMRIADLLTDREAAPRTTQQQAAQWERDYRLFLSEKRNAKLLEPERLVLFQNAINRIEHRHAAKNSTLLSNKKLLSDARKIVLGN